MSPVFRCGNGGSERWKTSLTHGHRARRWQGWGSGPCSRENPGRQLPVRAASGPGRGGAYLCTAATVYIGTHGVVGSSATHVQVCSVPGLDEPDEVPALTLGPERKPRRCPDACRAPCLPGVPVPPALPTPAHPWTPPHSRCHPCLRARTLQCAVGWLPSGSAREGDQRACRRGPPPWGPTSPHIPLPHIWPGPYNEGLAVDVMQVQGQHVVLAAHIHAVMVLVLEQDSVVACVEKEVEEVGGACGLKLCGWRAGQQSGHPEASQPSPSTEAAVPPHSHLSLRFPCRTYLVTSRVPDILGGESGMTGGQAREGATPKAGP